MSEEKENNLFEELDFGSFVNELENSIGEQTEETAENQEEELEEIERQNSEGSSQEEQDSEEDATPTEDTEEEATEEESEGGEEKETDENSSPLTPYAKLLVDEGILPNFNLEEFDGTPDGLKGAMEKEIVTGIENYKSQLPEEIKHLVSNYEEGVPLSRLLELDEKRTEYKSIGVDQLTESKDLQKAIMKDYYRNTTKFSDTKIDKLIQTSDDLESLESESKEALTDLISFQDEYEKEEVENAKQMRLQAEETQKQALEEFKTVLEKSDEIIPGLKISKNTKDTLYKTMTTAVAYDQAGNPVNKIAKYRVENPYEFDIKLSYLFEITKGFQDWSALSTAGRNKASKDFEEAIKRQDHKQSTGKGGKRQKSASTTSSLLDEISKFDFNK